MKNFKNLFLVALTLGSLTLTSCLHILEEVTFHDNGKGNYTMTLDMSEVKGMMEMLKTMSPDSTADQTSGSGQDNSMSQMGAGNERCCRYAQRPGGHHQRCGTE